VRHDVRGAAAMSMILPIFGLGLMCAGVICVFRANATAYRALDEVNAASPVDQRLGPLFMQTRLEKIWAKHEHVYFESRARERFNRLALASVVLVPAAVSFLSVGFASDFDDKIR
jgi:hypothetical protein